MTNLFYIYFISTINKNSVFTSKNQLNGSSCNLIYYVLNFSTNYLYMVCCLMCTSIWILQIIEIENIISFIYKCQIVWSCNNISADISAVNVDVTHS